MPEPVHISKIMPEVMSSIAERMHHHRSQSPGVLQSVEDSDMPSGRAQGGSPRHVVRRVRNPGAPGHTRRIRST
ncbi:MAG: hypothetical protein ABIF19_06085 [Planctomycetota bacterium]